MEKLPKLKYIGVTATGYNIIDIQAARDLGIIVTNVPEYSTEGVAESVFAHILCFTHRVSEHSESVRNGDWSASPLFSYSLFPLAELYGKTIGIVGMGHIGMRTAEIASAFGMGVIYTSRSSKSEAEEKGFRPVAFDTLLSESDYISLHVPLTPETENMINMESLRKMKQNAILINTARGGLIDEEALAAEETAEAPAAAEPVEPAKPKRKRKTKAEKEAAAEAAEPVAELAAESEPSAVEEVPVEEASALVEAEQPSVADKQERESFFARLRKTRDNLASGVGALIFGRKIDDELYEELETALIMADLGNETTQMVIERLRDESRLRDLRDAGALRKNLKAILSEILTPCAVPLDVTTKKPYVILMVGVNGAGKTTTIGKLARKFQEQGLSVMLAAGDTFRAAAVEQLKEWGERSQVPVIAQATGSDSASVLYDAVTAAKARGVDVLLCDTAGRLQNKDNLMEELRKIVRVMKKIDPEIPHETLLVLDAATGQNAVSQTKIFKEAVEVSGLVLTKLDGSAKGGVVINLAHNYHIPIRYVGIGEKVEDLREFKVEPFVDALIDSE